MGGRGVLCVLLLLLVTEMSHAGSSAVIGSGGKLAPTSTAPEAEEARQSTSANTKLDAQKQDGRAGRQIQEEDSMSLSDSRPPDASQQESSSDPGDSSTPRQKTAAQQAAEGSPTPISTKNSDDQGKTSEDQGKAGQPEERSGDLNELEGLHAGDKAGITEPDELKRLYEETEYTLSGERPPTKNVHDVAGGQGNVGFEKKAVNGTAKPRAAPGVAPPVEDGIAVSYDSYMKQENTVPNSHDALRGSAATKKNNRDQHTFPMPYDIFAMFDKDKNGELSYGEFQKMILSVLVDHGKLSNMAQFGGTATYHVKVTTRKGISSPVYVSFYGPLGQSSGRMLLSSTGVRKGDKSFTVQGNDVIYVSKARLEVQRRPDDYGTWRVGSIGTELHNRTTVSPGMLFNVRKSYSVPQVSARPHLSDSMAKQAQGAPYMDDWTKAHYRVYKSRAKEYRHWIQLHMAQQRSHNKVIFEKLRQAELAHRRELAAKGVATLPNGGEQVPSSCPGGGKCGGKLNACDPNPCKPMDCMQTAPCNKRPCFQFRCVPRKTTASERAQQQAAQRKAQAAIEKQHMEEEKQKVEKLKEQGLKAAQAASVSAPPVSQSSKPGSPAQTRATTSGSNTDPNYVANLDVGGSPSPSPKLTSCTRTVEERDAEGRIISTKVIKRTTGVDKDGASVDCTENTVTAHTQSQQSSVAVRSENSTTTSPTAPQFLQINDTAQPGSASTLPPLLQHETFSYTRTRQETLNGKKATITTKVTITPKGAGKAPLASAAQNNKTAQAKIQQDAATQVAATAGVTSGPSIVEDASGKSYTYTTVKDMADRRVTTAVTIHYAPDESNKHAGSPPKSSSGDKNKSPTSKSPTTSRDGAQRRHDDAVKSAQHAHDVWHEKAKQVVEEQQVKREASEESQKSAAQAAAAGTKGEESEKKRRADLAKEETGKRLKAAEKKAEQEHKSKLREQQRREEELKAASEAHTKADAASRSQEQEKKRKSMEEEQKRTQKSIESEEAKKAHTEADAKLKAKSTQEHSQQEEQEKQAANAKSQAQDLMNQQHQEAAEKLHQTILKAKEAAQKEADENAAKKQAMLEEDEHTRAQRLLDQTLAYAKRKNIQSDPEGNERGKSIAAAEEVAQNEGEQSPEPSPAQQAASRMQRLEQDIKDAEERAAIMQAGTQVKASPHQHQGFQGKTPALLPEALNKAELEDPIRTGVVGQHKYVPSTHKQDNSAKHMMDEHTPGMYWGADGSLPPNLARTT